MAKNVIIMIGDGMGWEIARAAAIQKQITQGKTGATLTDFYTEGKGTGLNFQELDNYALATTSGTYIDGSKSNSALKGNTLNRETGVAVVREGFDKENLPGEDANGEFDPAQVIGFFPELREGSIAPILGEFDPNFDERPLFAENEKGELVQVGGFLNAYDTTKGRPLPWLKDSDRDYPKNLFPDSANTATTLYSGVKTYSGAIGVDIYEDDIKTIGEKAREQGKSFGVVSSVPFNHATPASAIGYVSQRNKLTATERVENNKIALDENGVPLHEEHGDGSHEGEPVFELDKNGNPIPIEDDNILFQILNETQPELVLAGGHPDGRGDERYMDLGTLEQLRNGETVYTFTERGENAAGVLAEVASKIDVNAGEKLFGLYGARGQGGNLPWSTADGDYSNAGLSSRLDAVRPLKEGETDEQFIASEKDANPTLAQLTTAALDVLGDDEDGFWVSIEGGDIDWAAHDNNLDNMIGATLNFADSVEVVQDWIAENGGYEENLLIVTADHDHYFTLNEDFPELLREFGAEALTTAVDQNGNPVTETNPDGELVKVDNLDPVASGHYWGSNPDVKVGWSHHTSIPVPVYYQGAGSEYLDNSVGKGFEQYGFQVPGIEGLIDQVHIAEAQFAAFENDTTSTPDSDSKTPTLVSGTPQADTLIGGIDFKGVGNTIFTGAGDDEIDLAFGGNNNRVDAGSGNDVIYLSNQNRALGGEGDDKFFAHGGNNILSGGKGADQFWIVSGEIPEAANTIVDFEVGIDVIGILGSASLGIDANTLKLTEMDGNTKVAFGDNTLAMINGVTALDQTSFAFGF